MFNGIDIISHFQDIDTRPEDIRYNHHAIPNGELVRVDDPTRPVFQFTQADLNDKKILFKHLGSLFGRIMLWVSDGQYFVSTELKVRASQPFVRLVNNSGLIVQRGDSGFLSPSNLSIETNLNAFGDDIVYKILEGPTCGQILKDDVPIASFTDRDLKEESIEYRNNNSIQYKDFMRFSVQVRQDSYFCISTAVPITSFGFHPQPQPIHPPTKKS